MGFVKYVNKCKWCGEIKDIYPVSFNKWAYKDSYNNFFCCYTCYNDYMNVRELSKEVKVK